VHAGESEFRRSHAEVAKTERAASARRWRAKTGGSQGKASQAPRLLRESGASDQPNGRTRKCGLGWLATDGVTDHQPGRRRTTATSLTLRGYSLMQECLR
jgi:hypothetical protein